MKKNLLMICLSALVLMTACSEKFPGYKKTADGLYYKFYQQNAAAAKPNLSDFVKVQMACYLNDSLYYDWQSLGSDVYTQLTGSKFAGDLQEAYMMMRVGDSASFYIKADSIAVRYYNQNPEKPPFLQPPALRRKCGKCFRILCGNRESATGTCRVRPP